MDGKKYIFVKALIALCCIFIVCEPVFARSCDIVTGNPPVSVVLNPSCQLIVNYNFGSQMTAMLCISNVIHSGIIAWPSRGSLLSAPLPVLLSKITNDKKLFIDPAGQFKISNNTAKPLNISCEFSA